VTDPESPQGVRLQYADGSTTDALPLVYRGVDDDGLDVWEVLAPDRRQPTSILVGLFPAASVVQLAIVRDEP